MSMGRSFVGVLVGLVFFVSLLGCQTGWHTGWQSEPVRKRSSRSVQVMKGAVVGRIENPGWRSEKPIPLQVGAFDGSTVDFKPHEDHLALNLPFEPTSKVHRLLQKTLGVKLHNRGEAHITVISPPEFETLKSHVTMAEIEAIAERMELQKSKLRAICLGRGQTVVDGKLEQTYFIVVDGANLFEVRRAVRNRVLERQGPEFDSENYHPHVTVGFTSSDLHIREGVVKGTNSCLYPLAPRK